MPDEAIQVLTQALRPVLGDHDLDESVQGLRSTAFTTLAIGIANAIAHRDGRIDDRERNRLRQLLVELGIVPSDDAEIADALLSAEPLEKVIDEAVLSRLAPLFDAKSASLVWSIGLEMALADDELHGDERALLDAVRAGLPVDDGVAEVLLEHRVAGTHVPANEVARLSPIHPGAVVSLGVGATHAATAIVNRVAPVTSSHDSYSVGREEDDQALRQFDTLRKEALELYGEALELRRYLPPKNADDLELAQAALREDRFQLTVLGEFSRGKSTLLNALLGGAVLPRAVVPCNASLVRMQYSDTPEFVIRAAGSDTSVGYREFCDRLFSASAEDVTERARAAASVEEGHLRLPHPLLSRGVSIVDTPGLNETRALEEVVKRELERSDAILLVVSAVQPITRLELEVLDNLDKYAAENSFVVCNFMDMLRKKDAGHVRDRVRNTLEERLRQAGSRTFFVAAEPALAVALGEAEEGDRQWAEALSELRSALSQFFVRHRGNAMLGRHLGRLQEASDQLQETVAELVERERAASAAERQQLVDRLREEVRWVESQLEEHAANKARLAKQVDLFMSQLTRDVEATVQSILQEIVEQLPAVSQNWESTESFLKPWAVARDFGEQVESFIGMEMEERLAQELPPILDRRTQEVAQRIGKDAANLYAAASGIELDAAALELQAEDPEAAGMRLLKSALGVVLVGPAGFLAGAGSFTELIGMGIAGFVTAFLIAFFGGGPITVAIGVAVSATAVALLGADGMKRKVRDKLVKKVCEEFPGSWPNMRQELRAKLKDRKADVLAALESKVDALADAAQQNLEGLREELEAAEQAESSTARVELLEVDLARVEQLRSRVVDLERRLEAREAVPEV
jgi:predicted GTPase